MINLNNEWTLNYNGNEVSGDVPCSLYSVLLENELIPDPFYRDNELKVLPLSNEDCEFTKRFAVLGDREQYVLRFDGIDTLADIYLNGVLLGSTNNMHRTWEYDIPAKLLRFAKVEKDERKYSPKEVNELKVVFHSPVKYIKEENEKVYAGGVNEAMSGYPHLRKAHCMFGWDWGPRLPDMGIFRDVTLFKRSEKLPEDIYITQVHNEDGSVDVTLRIRDAKFFKRATITGPRGRAVTFSPMPVRDEEYCFLAARIRKPLLWWPNGYGEQNLYTVRCEFANGDVVKRIGLRTLTVNTEPDEWGNCFAHEVNGVKIFAMGADYIPEDNLLSRVNKERTRKLLEDAAAANHNSIRVWGGGYYPDDFFYDICDELGLIVWQDFMFACASYELTEDFDKNIRAEIRDNVRRLRHHASLGLWCGNNEMETQTLDRCWKPSKKQYLDYIKIFEYIIPAVLGEEDPETFYWPSSPSSGGNFDNPWDESRGDMHYWTVWHGCKPFTDHRNHCFRYLSEFGFQAFPEMKTIESFTEPADRNVYSRVMEMHQRNTAANGKITNYLSATYLYPENLPRFVYLSQLLQAEAIRYGVEHNRRHRGQCMGTVVWQLNDIWPVASWSGIDYYGRWKALHYAEKRMFAPVLISCEEHGELDQREFCIQEPGPIELSGIICVSNETLSEVTGDVIWALRDSRGEIVKHGRKKLSVPALSSVSLRKLVFEEANELEHYLSFEFVVNGEIVSEGSCLFCAPKHYNFTDPELSARVSGDEIIISSKGFAKSVAVTGIDGDVILEDNYFDMNPGEKRIRIVRGQAERFELRYVNEDKVIEFGR